MYIIEKLVKQYLEYKNGNSSPIVLPDTNDEAPEDIVGCKHNFMPIDSTGNILACSKCGYLVKKGKLKQKT